jgi:hypothetical protein
MGVHWGPRALLPAFPALVAAAVAAARRPSAAAGRRGARAAVAAFALLVLAGAVSSAQAVRLLAAQKADARSFEAVLRAQRSRYVVTTHPLLAQQLAGLWHERPMLLARDPAALANVLAGLASGGAREFSLVVPAGGALLSGVDGLVCRLAERHRGPRLHYFDLDVQTCAFRPPGDPRRGRGSRFRSR